MGDVPHAVPHRPFAPHATKKRGYTQQQVILSANATLEIHLQPWLVYLLCPALQSNSTTF